MIPAETHELSFSVVQELVRSRAVESTTLELKQRLPSTSDRDRKEFVKDVVAMANSEGGDIVYGIGEQDGEAASIHPFTDEKPDEVIRRLGQILEARTQPRLVGIEWIAIDCGTGHVLVLRIPQSQITPHAWNFDEKWSFPLRNQNHVSEMNFEQIRASFALTARLGDGAMSFRRDRTMELANQAGLPGSALDCLAVVHAIPLRGMNGNVAADILAARRSPGKLRLDHWRNIGLRMNLDGLLVRNSEGSDSFDQVQLYRDGRIEAVCSVGIARSYADKPYIVEQQLLAFFRGAIRMAMSAPDEFGVGGGMLIGASLLNVEERLGNNPLQSKRADRRHLVLPEIWIENPKTTDPDEVSSSLMDTLWQCFNFERCPYFDQGRWTG